MRPHTKRVGCGNPTCRKTHWNLDDARACSVEYETSCVQRASNEFARAAAPVRDKYRQLLSSRDLDRVLDKLQQETLIRFLERQ